MYQVNDVIRLNSGTLVLVKQIGSDYVIGDLSDGTGECLLYNAEISVSRVFPRDPKSVEYFRSCVDKHV